LLGWVLILLVVPLFLPKGSFMGTVAVGQGGVILTSTTGGEDSLGECPGGYRAEGLAHCEVVCCHTLFDLFRPSKGALHITNHSEIITSFIRERRLIR